MTKTLLLFTGIPLLVNCGYAFPIAEGENFLFSLDGYFRTDIVTLKNTVDLDSANSDDATTYLGIDYSLGLKCESKNGGSKLYLKLERNGPGDYDAPVFVHNTLINAGGRIEKYHNEQLLPGIEELWLDQPLGHKLGFKLGLYTYEVGNGFSLTGSFENYGVTFYQEAENFSWRLYYCRPDMEHKTRLGPHIPQEVDQGYLYEHNAANFFAADIKFGSTENFLQPYVGVLADYTSPGKRDNVFTAPIKRDILGTGGMAWNFKQEKFLLKTELAHNFGKAESADSDYKDISHAGYLAYTELGYCLGKLTPYLSFLLCSGNKVSLDAALNQEGTSASGKNRAFSTYSPLNKNLGDSISSCNSRARPVVAMGSGCSLHDGILRPRTLASSDFDNLILPSIGFDYKLTDKLSLELYWYYLMSFARGVGTWNGEAKYLSRDLGREIDLFLDYKLNPHITLSFLGGYFIPGRYYKAERDDTAGSLFSPFVRGDGDADPPYQVEFSLEFQF